MTALCLAGPTRLDLWGSGVARKRDGGGGGGVGRLAFGHLPRKPLDQPSIGEFTNFAPDQTQGKGPFFLRLFTQVAPAHKRHWAPTLEGAAPKMKIGAAHR